MRTVDLERAAQRVAALEKRLAPARRSARRWKRITLALGVLALVASAAATAAITSGFQEWKGLYGEVHKYDTATFEFGDATTGLASTAYSAQATTPELAAELDLVFAVASTAVPEGDWFYEVTVKEAGAALLGSGTYKANLLVNGIDRGALYFAQGTGLPLSIEGVTLRWDVGPSLSTAATYVVRIQAI